MHIDKNGKEIKIGDILEYDDNCDYLVVSTGACLDIPDEDEVVYGQRVEDMRVLVPFTTENLTRATIKED